MLHCVFEKCPVSPYNLEDQAKARKRESQILTGLVVMFLVALAVAVWLGIGMHRANARADALLAHGPTLAEEARLAREATEAQTKALVDIERHIRPEFGQVKKGK